jgi:hypothetical protein
MIAWSRCNNLGRFVDEGTTVFDVCVGSVTGSVEKVVSSTSDGWGMSSSMPIWSPDDCLLAVATSQRHDYGLSCFSRSGTLQWRIEIPPFWNDYLVGSWSPSGQEILLVDHNAVVLVDVTARTATSIYRDDAAAFHRDPPSWNVDGTVAVCVLQDKLLSFDSKTRKVDVHPHKDHVLCARFSKAGQYVFLQTSDEDLLCPRWFIPVSLFVIPYIDHSRVRKVRASGLDDEGEVVYERSKYVNGHPSW